MNGGEGIPRILCGIATVTPCKRFLESLPVFIKEVERRFLADLDCNWVWDKELVEAQNEFAESCIAGDYDYLLTIEDDHWGFTADMLASCLEAETDVCGICYRSRHFPFEKIPMTYERTDKNGVRRFTGMNYTEGYHEADLSGFGFTLIDRDVFLKLDKPYFRNNIDYYKGVGPRATDIDFSHRVQQAGCKVMGCFDHVLNHREITEESYKDALVSGILAKHSMLTRLQDIFKNRRIQ